MGEEAPTAKLLMAMAFFCVLLAGCAETGDKTRGNPSAKERGAGGASATTAGSTTSEATTSGTEVGEAFAQAELRPVDDSEVSGDVVFKQVGSLGVQAELSASGLPDPEEPYFAQVHEGSCSGAPKGSDQEHEDHHDGHEHEHGGRVPALALVRLDRFLPGGREEYADHAEYEDPPANELPGNVDTPLSLSASDDGTGAVTSLLEGVEPEQLSSGVPKYIDLRASNEGSPEEWLLLACANLNEAT